MHWQLTISKRVCTEGQDHCSMGDYFLSPWLQYTVSRENDRTESEAQGIGWDMTCPRKLFLDQRKSVFRDVRMHVVASLSGS